MANKSDKKVLLVEDEQALSRVMSLKLSNEGYSVIVADNGKTAIDYFNKEKPNIVLLDLMIPAIDGFTVLKEIKQKQKSKVPVFILSNLSQAEDKDKVRELGAGDYFVKSEISIREIISEVKKVLK